MMFIHLFLIAFLLLLPAGKAIAEMVQVVETEFLWSSPNLIKVDPAQDKKDKKSPPLKNFSFKNHFDLYGTYPSFKFLLPLIEGDSPLAQMKDRQILFRKTGKRIPLNPSHVPSWATPAPPYLVSIPMIDRVLVVYPYYAYQEKEGRYVTEMYSDQGVLLSTFESLPTHVSLDNPYLLVSPERSGCCESLKWSIRFYPLRKESVSEYSCPEGFCGDVLFTKLGNKGPFVIA